eukprot:558564-Amphidinium_carterae.1
MLAYDPATSCDDVIISAGYAPGIRRPRCQNLLMQPWSIAIFCSTRRTRVRNPRLNQHGHTSRKCSTYDAHAGGNIG